MMSQKRSRQETGKKGQSFILSYTFYALRFTFYVSRFTLGK